jgi:hypothetical protein
MKTTLHVHRHAPPAPAPARPSTLRLGLIVSAVAALTAVVVDILVDVPTAFILIPVVVVGFALSWHATGHDDVRGH